MRAALRAFHPLRASWRDGLPGHAPVRQGCAGSRRPPCCPMRWTAAHSRSAPKCSLTEYGFGASGVRTRASAGRAETRLLPRFLRSVLNRPSQQVQRGLAAVERFSAPSSIPQASILPTHAAAQHKKTYSDQRVKPCWKNQPTLKLWRESHDSERKSPTIPPLHHQGFWQKARKYSEISKLA